MAMNDRDEFAKAALPAVLNDALRVLEREGFPDENWRVGIAQEAYKMADAMLAARAQNPEASHE
ncbi:hypothetical protein [Diaphorobacter caeni]|uniref:hypothetical protein n=1 Tax=Diaphorobacter caeni TaxID=2784387 RepID=UPI001890A17E|nr:hypothetical protein [Diaphorobacter caeni]MBF5007629.1 hypothetical protein [Diaphorobacter caeni]